MLAGTVAIDEARLNVLPRAVGARHRPSLVVGGGSMGGGTRACRTRCQNLRSASEVRARARHIECAAALEAKTARLDVLPVPERCFCSAVVEGPILEEPSGAATIGRKGAPRGEPPPRGVTALGRGALRASDSGSGVHATLPSQRSGTRAVQLLGMRADFCPNSGQRNLHRIRVGVGRTWADSCRLRSNSSAGCPNFGQTAKSATWDRNRPTLGRVRSMLGRVRRIPTKLGVDQIWHRSWPDVGQSWARCRSNLARCRSKLGHTRRRADNALGLLIEHMCGPMKIDCTRTGPLLQ